MSIRRMILAVVGIAIIIFVVLQLVPVEGRTNPEPHGVVVQWDSAQTEALMRRACYDCHTNDTNWPWYAYVAPVSWLVAQDVREGRAAMNLSTGRGEIEGEELIEQIERGAMPLPNYLIMHPEANLNAQERAQLIAGIQASLGEGER